MQFGKRLVTLSKQEPHLSLIGAHVDALYVTTKYTVGKWRGTLDLQMSVSVSKLLLM